MRNPHYSKFGNLTPSAVVYSMYVFKFLLLQSGLAKIKRLEVKDLSTNSTIFWNYLFPHISASLLRTIHSLEKDWMGLRGLNEMSKEFQFSANSIALFDGNGVMDGKLKVVLILHMT